AEAGSSVDADILAAQSFLRQHHPEVDIPDHFLSELIYDNAEALQDTAHDLDGSMGIAEAQAIAILGPVVSQHKRIYAVVCVGGHNNDCLLLHQLQVRTGNADDSRSSHPAQSKTSQAKGKSKATDSSRLIFFPAHSAEQMFHTPILQIIASADRELLAVRTHSSTSFLSLHHRNSPDGSPWLHLEGVHQARYGTNEIAQHQDVCFGHTGSTLAATVDRHGNIDLYRFKQEEQHPQHQDPTLDQAAPSSDVAASSASKRKRKKRQNILTASPAPTLEAASAPVSVTVQRIPTKLFARSTADAKDNVPDDSHSTGRPRNDEASIDPELYRVLFAQDHGSLFVLTRHALLRVPLEHSGPEPAAETDSNIHTVLESSLCLSSYRRARFFSMAMTRGDAEHQLLAVCSSDTIFWFDLRAPFQPLFSTEHYRGDDPTLTLSYLPGHKNTTATPAQAKDNVIMCVLSSRRNELSSCYVLSSHQRQGPGHDLLRGVPATDHVSAKWAYTLHTAPVLLPKAASPAPRHDGPAAPPIFIDAADVLQREDGSPSYLTFRLDQRGALLAHFLQLSPISRDEASAQFNADVGIEILPPPFDSHLYTDDTETSQPVQANTDAATYVKTKILNYQKLHRSLFASPSKSSATSQRIDAVNGMGSGAARLDDLFNASSKGHAAIEASTLSLGQLICRLNQDADVNRQSRASRDPWFNVLDLDSDEEAEPKRAKAILDLRDDLRRALPALSTSSAQGAWSRAATVVSGHRAKSHSSLPQKDILRRALDRSHGHVDNEAAAYLPTKRAVQAWSAKERGTYQESLRRASRQMMLDLALEAEVFARPKARILDEGAPRQRPQQRQGTNWTAFEHREIYRFVQEQGDVIPPPHIGTVGLSFFAPLRSGDVEAAAARSGREQDGTKRSLDEAELEALLPSTSSTARLLLAEWQLGEDPADYNYLDPFQGLHRLPRASRLRGPTARARSRSFSRASSASNEDRSRSRSRNRKQSAAPSLSQSVFDSQGPLSSYPPSLMAASQASVALPAPPTLVSRRKRQRDDIISRSQPIRAPTQVYDPPGAVARQVAETPSAAQSQPAAPRFGFAGSFGDLTPTVSPASLQVGTPTQTHLGAASTQIEAGRFGARPLKADRPPKKKKRASGF
ncbi:hypothetical protein, partial [Sporisorium scitamineum]